MQTLGGCIFLTDKYILLKFSVQVKLFLETYLIIRTWENWNKKCNSELQNLLSNASFCLEISYLHKRLFSWFFLVRFGSYTYLLRILILVKRNIRWPHRIYHTKQTWAPGAERRQKFKEVTKLWFGVITFTSEVWTTSNKFEHSPIRNEMVENIQRRIYTLHQEWCLNVKYFKENTASIFSICIKAIVCLIDLHTMFPLKMILSGCDNTCENIGNETLFLMIITNRWNSIL